MITITLPGEDIAEYRDTSKGLEVTFKSTDWNKQKTAAFGDLREAFELSDAESDEFAEQLETILLMRTIKTAVSERSRR